MNSNEKNKQLRKKNKKKRQNNISLLLISPFKRVSEGCDNVSSPRREGAVQGAAAAE